MFALRKPSPASQMQQPSGSRYRRESMLLLLLVLLHGLRSIHVLQQRIHSAVSGKSTMGYYVLFSTFVGGRLLSLRRRVAT